MQPLVGLPPMLAEYLECFRPAFRRVEAYTHFTEYITGLICSTQFSVECIARMFTEHRDPSTKRKFLTASSWTPSRVMTRCVGLVKKHADFERAGRGYLVIDDIQLEHDKESGKSEHGMEALLWHKRHDDVGYVNCHLVVTLHWVTPHAHFPIGFRIRMPNGVTRHNLARWLIKRAMRLGLKFGAVLFDGWYLGPVLMEFCKEYGLSWISCLKSNRTGWIANEKRNIQEWFMSRPAEEWHEVEVHGQTHCVATKTLRLNDHEINAPGERVKVVMIRELGRSKEPRMLATNQLAWTAESILRAYYYRWMIEMFYRDGNQHLGLESYMLRSVEAIKRHLTLVFVAFSLLQLSALDPKLRHLVGKPSVGDLCRKAATQALSLFIAWSSRLSIQGYSAEEIAGFSNSSRAEIRGLQMTG